jgi:protein-tyrosine kinase
MKQLKITKFPALDYAGSEAFNTLSTNLSFAGENIKKIMITSCHASEGKSYLSINLARALAQRGKRVALVDADLRRSMINSTYGVRFEHDKSGGSGLSHFLAGMVGMDEVVYQTDITNMLMVPVGREVPNPLALLSGRHFEELLDTLAKMVDYVIVDAPPVGVVIDAAEIAKVCDGTMIAVHYNDVRRQELLDVKQQIEQSGCPILGTVLNQVDYDNYLGRKYYYKSYYKYSRYKKYGYYNKYYTHEHSAEKK